MFYITKQECSGVSDELTDTQAKAEGCFSAKLFIGVRLLH